MMQVLERFPQIGGITGYLELPPGERLLYQHHTLDALEKEARMPVLRIDARGGGRR